MLPTGGKGAKAPCWIHIDAHKSTTGCVSRGCEPRMREQGLLVTKYRGTNSRSCARYHSSSDMGIEDVSPATQACRGKRRLTPATSCYKLSIKRLKSATTAPTLLYAALSEVSQHRTYVASFASAVQQSKGEGAGACEPQGFCYLLERANSLGLPREGFCDIIQVS